MNNYSLSPPYVYRPPQAALQRQPIPQQRPPQRAAMAQASRGTARPVQAQAASPAGRPYVPASSSAAAARTVPRGYRPVSGQSSPASSVPRPASSPYPDYRYPSAAGPAYPPRNSAYGNNYGSYPAGAPGSTWRGNYAGNTASSPSPHTQAYRDDYYAGAQNHTLADRDPYAGYRKPQQPWVKWIPTILSGIVFLACCISLILLLS